MSLLGSDHRFGHRWNAVFLVSDAHPRKTSILKRLRAYGVGIARREAVAHCLGRPRPLMAMMLRWISDVPPPIPMEGELR